MKHSIGYQYLIDRFDLNVCDLLQKSYATDKTQKEIIASGDSISLSYPESRLRLTDCWQDNLVFALKNEGVNLEILKAFLVKVSEGDIVDFIKRKPNGGYSRKVWFLYEWIFDKCLDIADLSVGNYLPLVDETYQFALPEKYGTRAKRYRIINNLIGNREFCPLVRYTDDIRKAAAPMLKRRAEALLKEYSPELIYRAVRYLFVKETKSSFEIERETPNQRRMDAFVGLLTQTPREEIDERFLVGLQNQIVEERYRQSGWRTDQVYVGETMTPGYEKVHFIAVKPKDVAPMMQAYLAMLNRCLLIPDIDAVILAAILSFAFVFIHPFDDGNGRLHRYLMHAILSRCAFTPPEFIFPVSAVLLKKAMDYDRMLESFSSRVMRKLDYEMEDDGEVSVSNDSIDFYRYIDFTPIVNKFQAVIKDTIDTEWRVELDYLRGYDSIRKGMRDIVDMPEKKANQFIAFTMGNGGHLSKAKRGFFPELTDDEVSRLESIVAKLRISNPLPLHG